MSQQQRRGKLAASFLGISPSRPAQEQGASGSLMTVNTQAIEIVPGFNPRSLLGEEAFTPEALEGLTASLRIHGVLQPLLVRRVGDSLLLIAGERRLRAARLASLTEVPVRVFDIGEAAARVLAIIENAQREEVDVVSETLLGFELLQEHTGLSEGDLLTYLQAVRKGRAEDSFQVEALLRSTYGTGISVWSQRRATVLRMTQAERQAIRQRQTDVAVCAELVKVKDATQRDALLKRVIREQLSAPQLRHLLQLSVSSNSIPSFQAQVSRLRRQLGKLERLEGVRAEQARKLISRLEALLED